MTRLIPHLAAAAALASIAACAGGITEVTGPVEVGNAYTVTLERPWNRLSDSLDGTRTRGDILTQDGAALNMIRLVGGLNPGDYIVKPVRREFPTPTYEADMTELELVEFVTDTLAALGYEQVETSNVRPEPFGTAPGIGMGLAAVTPRGLRLKGDARLAKSGKHLNVIVFMAPEMHFYETYADEVERLFASAQLK